jgi:O-antigen/teichoic acid export membrane protein
VDLKKQAILGVVWSAVAVWGRQIIAFVVFALLARILDAKAFGLLSLAYVFLSFVQIFVHQGFTVAIVQREQIDDEDLDTAFWSNLLISIVLTVFSISIAGYIAELFKQPEIEPVIQGLSINLVLYALSAVQNSILQRRMLFKSIAVRSLIAILAGGLVGSVMALKGFGVWSLVGKQLAESLFGVIVLWNASKWRPRFRFSKEKFKDLFAFGSAILGIEISNYVSENSDNFLIGYFLGSIALGYYSIAYKLLYISTGFITSVIGNITIPTFSRLQHEPERLRKAFYIATKLNNVINFPIFTIIALLAPQIVTVVFGEKWLSSAKVIQVFAIMGIYQSLQYLLVSVIISMGKPQWRFKIMLLSSAINVLLFLRVTQFGILAVAWALTAQSLLISLPLYLLAVKKLINIEFKEYIKEFWSSTISSFLMAIFILLMKQLLIGSTNSTLFLLSTLLAGVMVYAILIRLLDPNLFRYLLGLLPKRNALIS